jgi:hypothetical protein
MRAFERRAIPWHCITMTTNPDGSLGDWITRMNLFKTFTLKWWQGALFKWGVLAAGMAIGTYWSGFLADYLLVLLIFAFVSLAYITYVWSKQ